LGGGGRSKKTDQRLWGKEGRVFKKFLQSKREEEGVGPHSHEKGKPADQNKRDPQKKKPRPQPQTKWVSGTGKKRTWGNKKIPDRPGLPVGRKKAQGG